MQRSQFEPVTDPEVFRHAFEMLAIANVATHRAQVRNRALNIPNYDSIAGRLVSDCEGGETEAIYATPCCINRSTRHLCKHRLHDLNIARA